MTMYEEPPIVDLEEILEEENEAETRATGPQLVLVVIGGIVATAGMLTVLVVTAPSWLQLIRAIVEIAREAGAR